jgi:hypothetical protein
MQCEEPGTSSTQVKRTAEEIQDSDAMVEFLEILNADVEDEDHVYIMFENGEWCPEEMSRVGDLKEAQGLFDKEFFEIVRAERNQQVATYRFE